ncbi:hypothetical protein B0J13DRAFT_562252 [Dactylonectria estremocensis]|uniref:Uncharacterized protein n=1 Tax=Dactylonectria estremocensis TaxID=1079267 RepID=A0A9P9IV19_9HYPO|nr:hypothetical protein B0J13DRAFT_562252 [Dactylonectria estremocensis]
MLLASQALAGLSLFPLLVSLSLAFALFAPGLSRVQSWPLPTSALYNKHRTCLDDQSRYAPPPVRPAPPSTPPLTANKKPNNISD